MYKKLIEKSEIENLVLFRHGKAERPYEASSDFDRELIERGKYQAYEQAKRLYDLGFRPDVVLVSSALRASQTWDAAAPIFQDAQAFITRELYLASSEIYLQKAIATAKKNVMIIAHDPGLHDLCKAFLKGAPHDKDHDLLRLELTTAGIAWFKRDEKAKNKMALFAGLRPIPKADI